MNAAKSDLTITLGGGDSGLDSVTSDLTLPTTGLNGTTISWVSSDESVISTGGVVTQPSQGSGDATVTLTATITKDGVVLTKTFEITVAEETIPPGTEDTVGWDKVIDVGTNSDDKLNQLAVDASGNVYAVGQTDANGTGLDWHILKFESDGTAATFTDNSFSAGATNEVAWDIAIDGSTVYVGGNTTSSYGIWHIKKYDLNGNEDTGGVFPISKDWVNTTGNWDALYTLAVDGAGNILGGGGVSEGTTNGVNLGITAFDPATGAIVTGWETSTHNFSYNGVSHGYFESVLVAGDGSVYACGFDTFDNGGAFMIRKFSSDGTHQASWDKDFTTTSGAVGSGPARCYGSAEDSTGALYFVGSIDTGEWSIKKFNPDGSEITTGWDKAVAIGDNNAWIKSIAIDGNDNVYATGFGENVVHASSGADIVLRAWDADGNELTGFAKEYDGGGDTNDGGNTLVIDGDALYLGGYANDGTSNNLVIKKFSL